uniref:F-box domain-containing protein n=1 Tax=viral metagenome TaxID=1070528 RepID=A0A6C0KB68_9ZZZZ
MTRLLDLPADLLVSVANHLPNKCALRFECSYDLVNILRGPGRTLCEAVDYCDAKYNVYQDGYSVKKSDRINRFNPLWGQVTSRYSITALVIEYDYMRTDDDFDAIAKLPLKSLRYSSQNDTDNAMEIRGLAKLPQTLEDAVLYLQDDRVMRDVIPSLRNIRKLKIGFLGDLQCLSMCDKLEELKIDDSIDQHQFNELASCPQLKVLRVQGLYLYESVHLHNHPLLRRLEINYWTAPALSVDDIRRILQGIPTLLILHIRVEDPSVYAELADCPKLVVGGLPT